MFANLRGRLYELAHGIIDVRGHSPMFARVAVNFAVKVKGSPTPSGAGGSPATGVTRELEESLVA